MFKNKTEQGRNNLCGRAVYRLRTGGERKLSQRVIAERMQLFGIDVDKNAIQRIESGQRFVTDIELATLAKIFGVSCEELLREEAE